MFCGNIVSGCRSRVVKQYIYIVTATDVMLASTPVVRVLFNRFTKCHLPRRLSTGSYICGINQYTKPIRNIIIDNERKKELIKMRQEYCGISKPEEKAKFYYNRNPRHLEILGYNKPAGFTTSYDSRNFYNKLLLEITNHHTKAYVENINGEILCYASTTEHYIAKQLHGCTDVMAVVNIARVLAERLKQIGITRVHWHTRLDRTTEKIREFEGVLQMNDIILSELPVRVLEGPSQTLPPPPPPRKLPGQKTAGWKRRGTIARKADRPL